MSERIEPPFNSDDDARQVRTHIRTLRERRDWLTARIGAKESVGWETLYDTRERDALAWVLIQIGVDK